LFRSLLARPQRVRKTGSNQTAAGAHCQSTTPQLV
ncbi:uncharacterized protein METZ01_LOCUS414522, partial [marine metagenome]